MQRDCPQKLLLPRAALLALLAAACCASASANIEKEPVRVTHRNSGPRYELESEQAEPGRPGVEQVEQAQRSPQPEGDSQAEQLHPVGRISIRRIFLVPMRAPEPSEGSIWSSGSAGEPATAPSEASKEEHQAPSMFSSGSASPFWPFLPVGPSRPSQQERPRHHMFGADQASRSPDSENTVPSGSEQEAVERLRPILDPIQMMVDLMHQALAGAHPPVSTQEQPVGPESVSRDLNKEASTSGETESVQPTVLAVSNKANKPKSNSETREDVVEIDGKKYLRKTMINEHVGDNIVFMTRRLMFVPLNETDTTTTTTTTTAPSVNALAESSTPQVAGEQPSSTGKPVDTVTSAASSTIEASSPTTTTTTTGAVLPSESPSTTSTTTTSVPTTAGSPSSTEAPLSSTGASGAESTTSVSEDKKSWQDKVSDAVERVAERILEKSNKQATEETTSSTTVKP